MAGAVRGSGGFSGRGWWGALVTDLALLQGGNTAVGFLVDSIDVAERSVSVAASWADGSTASFSFGPEADREVLRDRLGEVGPGLPQPELDNRFFWVPDSESSPPLLVHAWVLQELARPAEYPEAAGKWGEELEFRCVSGDAEQIEVILHLVSRGYGVRIPVEISPPGSKYVDLAYELTELACTASTHDLRVAEPHHEMPTYRGPVPALSPDRDE